MSLSFDNRSKAMSCSLFSFLGSQETVSPFYLNPNKEFSCTFFRSGNFSVVIQIPECLSPKPFLKGACLTRRAAESPGVKLHNPVLRQGYIFFQIPTS